MRAPSWWNRRGLLVGSLTGLALVAYPALVYLVLVVVVGRLLPGRGAELLLTLLAAALVALTLRPVTSALRALLPRATSDRLLRLTTDRTESGDLGPRLEELARLVALSFGGNGSAEITAQLTQQLTTSWSWPPGAALADRQDRRTVQRDIRRGTRDLGSIVVQLADDHQVSPIEERLLDDAADHAGLVIEAARMDQTLQQVVENAAARHRALQQSRRRILTTVEAERRRVERDIHDGAQQHLVALAVNLRLLRVLLTRDQQRAMAAATQLQSATREAIDTLERLSGGLYPPMLVEAGPVAALQAAASASPVPVAVVADRGQRWSAASEQAAYFACLEAVQNAIKHARASRIVVTIDASAAGLSFQVDDDGVGFEPAAAPTGSGTTNLNDRLSAVGGTVRVRTSPGHGTTVSGWIPCVAAVGL